MAAGGAAWEPMLQPDAGRKCGLHHPLFRSGIHCYFIGSAPLLSSHIMRNFIVSYVVLLRFAQTDHGSLCAFPLTS